MTLLLFISITLWTTVLAQQANNTRDYSVQNGVVNQTQATQCQNGQSGASCSNDNSTYILDLKGVFTVEYVMLYNREDCCLDSIIGAVIELLSKSDDTLYTCGTITEAKVSYNVSCNNKSGSKVRLRHLKNQLLKFGKFDVFGNPVPAEKVIVSRMKPTWQSSIFGFYSSSLAVDGRYDNYAFDNSFHRNCFHTYNDEMPFWTVDLQGTFNIDHVVLYNRMDCCSNRIIGATIELISEDGEVRHHCGQITDSKVVYNISCGNKIAQKVRIRGAANQYLHLCEVDVFGGLSPPPISRGKQTTQSSVYLGLNSSLAVDGNYENKIAKGENIQKTCFRTNLEEYPFFVVDLQGPFNIDRVLIYNRMDSCSGNICGAVVELLDKDGVKTHECGKINHTNAFNGIYCGNKQAYRVRVRGVEHQVLHFCEIDVFKEHVPSYPKIISRGKPTSQSSLYLGLDSALAVDGRYENYINRGYSRENCFVTNNDALPYWVVDLQGTSNIDHVVIYNRMDYGSEKIIGAAVELLSPNGEFKYQCGKITETKPVYNISCGNVNAQLVRIRGVYKQHLHLCEIDVFGDPIEENGTIISKGKPTNQSSVFWGFNSAFGVDGKYETFLIIGKYYIQNCFFTDDDTMPFWMVDLQGTFKIDHVSLYNRMDCCSERIIGAVVELLNVNGELVHECGKITESKAFYYISCGNRIAELVRVRGAPHQYLHLCEVDVFGKKHSDG